MGRDGRWWRRAWLLVVAIGGLGLAWPAALRRVSPEGACKAAWLVSPATVPLTNPPLRANESAASSDGTAWIVSSRALLSREAAEGVDPWGRPWLFEVIPAARDQQWVSLVKHFDDHVREQTMPLAMYQRGQSAWALFAGGLALLPYSTGPDGIDQAGQGDDVVMKPLLGGDTAPGWAWRRFMAHGRSRSLGLAGLLAWALVTWRVTRARFRSVAAEAGASAVLLLPLAAATCVACLSFASTIRRSWLARAWADRVWLQPELAVACTLVLGGYVGLLAVRLRKRQTAEPQGEPTAASSQV